MKIGFYTSTLGDRPAAEVIDFAAKEGFGAIEFDVRGHLATPEDVKPTVEAARAKGLTVSSITLFGNQLDPDPAARAALFEKTKAFLKATADAGVPIFVMFPGRNPNISEDDNYKEFAAILEAYLAATKGSSLKIVFENWPGPEKAFIAVTPAGWRKLFALVPDKRVGLEFDPSHLLWQGIDPVAARKEFADRIAILHGKDTAINKEKVASAGYFSSGWWTYVLPGRGLIDWKSFLAEAKAEGFDGVVSIEHEDREFGWPKGDLAARLEGLRRGLAHLTASLPK